MKKAILILFALYFSVFSLFAQSDDDLFGGSDDDLFGDDGIEEVVDVKAKSDLSKGLIFETGSIKIGGSLNSSIETNTVVYADDDKNFEDHLKESTLNPTLSALLSVDARPTEVLRIYTKFGFDYPFQDVAITLPAGNIPGLYSTTVLDYFKVKEAFTDFSVADRAYFRFGLHTVTWGTGIFFSPVSDIINASSINPEKTDEQVNGVLNLRTQITFPGTQNCLWAYVIPASTYKAIDTAFAAKGEFLLGGWEFGLGGYYKYQNAPKGVLTASGSLKKCTIFGEFVYQYGGASEWQANKEWDDKKGIFQATAGVSYMFKDPQIILMGQYYYDGNDKDSKQYTTYGHNIAVMSNFGKIFKLKNVTANVLGIVNFGKKDIPDTLKNMAKASGSTIAQVPTAIFSGTVNYAPFANFSVGCGPYIIVNDWEKAPVVSVRLSATLGGGKF